MILKIQVDKAIKELGIQADVQLADISTARGLAASADIVVTSSELADRLGKVDAAIVTITNFMDTNEMVEKIKSVLPE